MQGKLIKLIKKTKTNLDAKKIKTSIIKSTEQNNSLVKEKRKITMENNNETTVETTNSVNSTSSIEEALAKAKAAQTTTPTNRVPKPKKTEETKTVDKAEQDRIRAEKKAERDRIRAAKKAAREVEKAEKAAARAAKKAAREAEKAKKVPHLAKVEKAAEKLPDITQEQQEFIKKISQMGNQAMSEIIAHLEHELRVKSTRESLTQDVSVGQLVKIIAGPPDYLGLVGTVSEVRKIRVMIDVGRKSPAYLFRSDVTVIDPTEAIEPEEMVSVVETVENTVAS